MGARSRLDAIQGLRAIAYIAIFISHTGAGNHGCLGAWGVSVFLVMSGFLMMLSYLQKDSVPRFGLGFAWGKIKKLYPLHVVTTLFAALYAVKTGIAVKATLRDMGIHLLMVQMWIPKATYYTTLNGPAWYLCACFFLYLCFPLILRFFKKYMTKRRAAVSLAVLFAVVTLVSVINHFYGVRNGNEWFNVQWATYYFPPARLLDFAVGCVLGYLFSQRAPKEKKIAVWPTVLEVLVCLVILVSFTVYAEKIGLLGQQAFRYAFLFLPTTALLLWLVAAQRGVLSFVMSLKPLVWLGNRSPYTFLIHGVAIKYCRKVLFRFQITNVWLVALAAFVATLAAALAWEGLTKAVARLQQKKKQG